MNYKQISPNQFQQINYKRISQGKVSLRAQKNYQLSQITTFLE